MITNIYRGGLGNLMFQIATGLALAIEHNDNYGIDVKNHIEKGQGSHITQYINTIFSKIDKLPIDINSYHIFKETSYKFKPIAYTNRIILDGYFQSDKYFSNYKKQIAELFSLNYENKTISPICTIHIRTGDYIASPVFNVVTPAYFKNAITYIKSINPDISFKIITDNSTLARTYLPKDLMYEDLSSSDEIADLSLLTTSDYVIMSNSSFSWWGSYLGKDKITIAPDIWFNSYINMSDIYRNDMIKIPIK
jgi:hypothetical protein